MTGAVMLCVALTELTVALLAGRGPHATPTVRHRLAGLGVGAAVVLAAVLAEALIGEPPAAMADAGMVLFTLALAVGVAVAWAAAGSRPWASPVLVAVLLAVAAIEFAALGAQRGTLQPTWLVVLGAVAFLVEPANRITRDVLVLAGRPSEPDPAGSEPAVQPAAAANGGQDAAADAAPDAPAGEEEEAHDSAGSGHGSGLKGGRYIGPVERILMAGLGMAGAYQVVAALMAAKGIVRFPEISADAGKGSHAEEFLVGSLTSWGLAFVAAVIVTGALPVPLMEFAP